MSEPIIVTVEQGRLEGVVDTNLEGETFYKFLGIPYARPPVGDLRFKAPESPAAWEGIRDASKEGSPCLSLDFAGGQLTGSEDCLHLNVYTRDISPGGPLKPVMVYIHGGGFIIGSGSETIQGPKYLLTQDIVLVSVYYRLGVFGFLSAEDSTLDVPGNAGLKDQTFALRWVQANIASFNGDPGNVTLFGVSAGGASVHFQILSPTAKGLFHKAIVQSGSVLNPWAWGQRNVVQLAEKLGHHVDTEREALEALVRANAADVYWASKALPDNLLDASQRRPFGPIIEHPNPTAFLVEDPVVIMKEGRFNQVPTIMGIVNNEGLLSEFALFKSSDLHLVNSVLPWTLKHSEKFNTLAERLRKFYYETDASRENFHKAQGDVQFLMGILESIDLALIESTVPVYAYLLSYECPVSCAFKKVLQVDPDSRGISHGGDQSCLFNSILADSLGLEMTGDNRQVVDTMVKLWTDFAKKGVAHDTWKRVEKGQFRYLDIDRKLELIEGYPFAERAQFWKQIALELNGIDTSYDVKP